MFPNSHHEWMKPISLHPCASGCSAWRGVARAVRPGAALGASPAAPGWGAGRGPRRCARGPSPGDQQNHAKQVTTKSHRLVGWLPGFPKSQADQFAGHVTSNSRVPLFDYPEAGLIPGFVWLESSIFEFKSTLGPWGKSGTPTTVTGVTGFPKIKS